MKKRLKLYKQSTGFHSLSNRRFLFAEKILVLVLTKNLFIFIYSSCQLFFRIINCDKYIWEKKRNLFQTSNMLMSKTTAVQTVFILYILFLVFFFIFREIIRQRALSSDRVVLCWFIVLNDLASPEIITIVYFRVQSSSNYMSKMSFNTAITYLAVSLSVWLY